MDYSRSRSHVCSTRKRRRMPYFSKWWVMGCPYEWRGLRSGSQADPALAQKEWRCSFHRKGWRSWSCSSSGSGVSLKACSPEGKQGQHHCYCGGLETTKKVQEQNLTVSCLSNHFIMDSKLYDIRLYSIHIFSPFIHSWAQLFFIWAYGCMRNSISVCTIILKAILFNAVQHPL